MKDLNFIFKYCKRYKSILIIAPILLIVASAMDLLQPKLMSRIIDVGITDKNMALIKRTGWIMILFAIGSFASGIISTILSTVLSARVGNDLRKDTFDKLGQLSFRKLDDVESGKTITLLTNDIVQIQNLVMLTLNVSIKAPILILGSIVMALLTTPSLSWIIFIMTPIVFVLVFFILKKAYPIFMKVQKTIDNFNSFIEENLSGIRLIKAFVSYKFEEKKFAKINDSLTNLSLKANKIIILILPSLMLVVNATIIIILWFGGINVVNGEMQVGSIMAFINYIMQILTAIMILGMIFINMSRAQASIKRIKEFQNMDDPYNKECTGSIDVKEIETVEFKNVYFSFADKMEKSVIKDVSFTATKGQMVGVIGSTGSGKSTLAKLVAGLYAPLSGEVLLNGDNMKDISRTSLRNTIGLAPQKAFLFSGTIAENLRLSNKDANEETMQRATLISDAAEFVKNKPGRFDYYLEEEGGNLSGGQKQRINIARAVIKSPQILILDDSTSAVDAHTEVTIHDNIQKYMNDTITFFISQKISSIIDSDQIIVLNNGAIDGIGTHEELLKTSETYKDIFKSQIGEEAM